jgi:hypothetical protein
MVKEGRFAWETGRAVMATQGEQRFMGCCKRLGRVKRTHETICG